jgi:uncharacterized protein YdhG (YjbR/CyaY superfamily)
MVQSQANTVAEYVIELAPDRRPTFERLLETARSQLPGFQERIRYGMVSFHRVDGREILLAAQRQHVALYFGPGLLEQFAAELEGHDTGKGCLRFGWSGEVDWPLVGRILSDAAK